MYWLFWWISVLLGLNQAICKRKGNIVLGRDNGQLVWYSDTDVFLEGIILEKCDPNKCRIVKVIMPRDGVVVALIWCFKDGKQTAETFSKEAGDKWPKTNTQELPYFSEEPMRKLILKKGGALYALGAYGRQHKLDQV
jgi:hypothetical protein